jgi:hypothetical protein
MRPAVRLTRRAGGGFRLEGVALAPVDAVPDAGGFVVTGGAGPWRLSWSDDERGWLLCSMTGGSAIEVGRTSALGVDSVLAPSSVLLADGRLFRLAWYGASSPRVELGRWDLPGAYLVGSVQADGWELTQTVAGTVQDAPVELLILVSVEIGRLDGWHQRPVERDERAESR